MATSGTNNTVKWALSNGVLTISPTSGNSGIAKKDWGFDRTLTQWITLTADEISAVQTIIFTGDIQFYTNGYSGYSKETNLAAFMYDFSNTSEIDVSGLNTSGVKNFAMFFPESLMNLTGLSSMDVASGKDFYQMFDGTKLESLDLSTFPLNSADDISGMINRMSYCHTVKLPSNFSRKFAYISISSGQSKYYFGLASSRIPATKDGVTVTSDEDFFKLDSAQGGTWTRDISGSASLSFQVKSTGREANIAIVNYQYTTSSATVSIYLKKASESSFPSTSSKTVTISGTGSGSVEIELANDDAYDIKMIASDGNTSIYLYPSVSSNILLFEVDEEGNINVPGNLRTKGDLYAEGDANVSGSLRASGDVYTEGNIDISGGITAGGDVHAEEKVGYFGDLYLNNQTAHVGQVFNWQGNLKSNLTANADAYVEGNGSITLKGGHTYLVLAYVAMTNSTNGTVNRRAQIFNKTANSAILIGDKFVASQVWGTVETQTIYEASADVTLTVRGSASRPTTTIPTAWIRAVCIA